MTDPERDADERFLRAFWNDAAEGRARDLDHYLATHPLANPELVREEHAAHHGDALASEGRPRVGRFVVVEPIAIGGMGRVLRAWDPQLHKPVVLKTLLAGESALDPRATERLLREARLGGQLAGLPGVCPVLDLIEHEGRPVLVMPEIQGTTLAALLDAAPGTTPALRARSAWQRIAELQSSRGESAPRSARRPTSGPKDDVRGALLLVEQLARTVHALHERGFVHRDLKPDNVLVGPDGTPVLLDFGLALDVGSTAPRLSRDGEFVGTPAYMAPEQIDEGRGPIGPATDVYGLAALLHELLTGRPPHSDGTPAELAARILRAPAPPVGRLQPGLPRDLQVVVTRALEPDPAVRLQDAEGLAGYLRAVRTLRPIDLRTEPAAVRALRAARRHPRTVLLVAVTIVASGLVLALSWQQRGRRARLDELRHAFDPSTRAEERVRILERLGEPELARLAREFDARTSDALARLTRAMRADVERDALLWPRGRLATSSPPFVVAGLAGDQPQLHYAGEVVADDGRRVALRRVATPAGLPAHVAVFELAATPKTGDGLTPGAYRWRVGLDPAHHGADASLFRPPELGFVVEPDATATPTAPGDDPAAGLREAAAILAALERDELERAVRRLPALTATLGPPFRASLTSLDDALARVVGGRERLAWLRALVSDAQSH